MSSTGESTLTMYVACRSVLAPIYLRIFRNYLTCSCSHLQFPGREQVFESWPMGFHKVRNTSLALHTLKRTRFLLD